jgi:hypothetical protein
VLKVGLVEYWNVTFPVTLLRAQSSVEDLVVSPLAIPFINAIESLPFINNPRLWYQTA